VLEEVGAFIEIRIRITEVDVLQLNIPKDVFEHRTPSLVLTDHNYFVVPYSLMVSIQGISVILPFTYCSTSSGKNWLVQLLSRESGRP
jgi:hypothetical protein